MLTFLKNWTLPVAMLSGALIYWICSLCSFLDPVKPAMYDLIDIVTPALIFAQLLLTFCKVNPHDLLPAGWHWWLLGFQLITCAAVAALLIFLPMDETYHEIFEGAMVGLPHLSDGDGSSCHHRKAGRERLGIDYLHLVVEYAGCSGRPPHLPAGRSSCGDEFLAGIPKNIGESISSAAVPLHSGLHPALVSAENTWMAARIARYGVLSLGILVSYREWADSTFFSNQRRSLVGRDLAWRHRSHRLWHPVFCRQARRDSLRRPNQCRASVGTKKYRPGHLDGLYVFESALVSGSG